MAWDFDITFPSDTNTTLSSVKRGDLVCIDNWVNGKKLVIVLTDGSFNTSSGSVEWSVLMDGEVKTIQEWQMRVSERF